MSQGAAHPWADTSPSCHACAWEFTSPARGWGAQAGTADSLPSLQGVLLLLLRQLSGTQGDKATPRRENTPAPSVCWQGINIEIESFGPVLPPCKGKERRNSHSTAVWAIKPLLSNYHISLHQRLGDAKPKLHANARLGGGLLMLEACLIAPSNMAKAFSSLGKSTASHRLSPSSQAEGDRPQLQSKGLFEVGKLSGDCKKKKKKSEKLLIFFCKG